MSWHIDTADSLPPLAGQSAAPSALGLVEARLPVTRPPPPDGAIRVLAWRADVGTGIDDVTRFLRTSDAAMVMLAIRETTPASGEVGVIDRVASRLGAGHALALLDVEPADEGRFVAETVGLVSPHVLFKLGLERLPAGARGVGSPCALFAQLQVDRVNVTFVSVALDQQDGPDQRAVQMRTLLDRIDDYDRYLPVLIGGDMATTTFTPEELADTGRMRLVLHGSAQRLVIPNAHEPMFHLLRQRGYNWRSANVPLAPTGRSGPAGADEGQLYKRLWFFARGLVCDEPAIVPAQDGAGQPMGVHDALSLRIRPG